MGNVKVTLVVWLDIIEFVGLQALIIIFYWRASGQQNNYGNS